MFIQNLVQFLLGRPTVVGGLKSPMILLSSITFFISYPPSSLNGTQPNPATCS